MAEKAAKSVKKSATTAAAAPEAAAASPEAAAAAGPLRGTCTAEKCKQPLRAKGYCRKHFQAWRRGTLGVRHRYKTCTKEACRKPRQIGSLCAEHGAKGATAS
jgi:hypothetical protein